LVTWLKEEISSLTWREKVLRVTWDACGLVTWLKEEVSSLKLRAKV
jgi:hypothetical protein